MEIKEMFLTPNKYSRPQIPLKKVTKIAVHYAGNAGSTAKNTHDYFESLKDQIPDSTGKWWVNKDGTYRTWKGKRIEIRHVSSHFVVGLGGEVIQCKGIAKKVLMLIVVAAAHVLDAQIIGGGAAVRRCGM